MHACYLKNLICIPSWYRRSSRTSYTAAYKVLLLLFRLHHDTSSQAESEKKKSIFLTGYFARISNKKEKGCVESVHH